MMGLRHHFRAAWAALSDGALHLVDVTLHLGAHRTGTTTLQVYLNENRDHLSEINTEFWGPNRTRSGLFSGMVKKPRDVNHSAVLRGERSSGLIRMEMDRLDVAGVKSLIVSEENMIGTMADNLSEGKLYPDAQARLDRFTNAFGFRCRRIVLSVRSYEKYWASVLSFMVQRGRAAPDASDLDRLVTQPRRWRNVINEVAAAFPTAEVMIWPFERLAGQPEQQLALLNNGQVPNHMRGRNNWHNASVGCSNLRGVLLDRGDLDTAATLPDDTSRWQPFEAHHIAALRAEYDEDIAWLRSGADGNATYIENTDTGSAGAHLRPMIKERGHFHDQEERGVG